MGTYEINIVKMATVWYFNPRLWVKWHTYICEQLLVSNKIYETRDFIMVKNVLGKE